MEFMFGLFALVVSPEMFAVRRKITDGDLIRYVLMMQGENRCPKSDVQAALAPVTAIAIDGVRRSAKASGI